MIVSLEGVLAPPKDGYRELKRFAYTHEESVEAERTESVQDANHALMIVRKLCGDAISEGVPPRDADHQPCWIIQIQVTNTHRACSSYRVAYRKFNGCPLMAIEDMMEIYAAIKRVVREARNSRRERKKSTGKGRL